TYNAHTQGNGHIYYAGMESVGGGAPRFFVGDTAPTPLLGEQISMLFDSSATVPGQVQGNTITIHVPYADIPAAKPSRVLYSAIAFTATAAGTLANNPAGAFNLTDATVPFDVALDSHDAAASLPLPAGWARLPLGVAALGLLAWTAWRIPSSFRVPTRRRLRIV
ncbi:MAG TPA: hypothetical protein VH274_03100, partial [Mycobacteriales bacterium]|nr:hypothetical protein [Mycobacteriales bacterium]